MPLTRYDMRGGCPEESSDMVVDPEGEWLKVSDLRAWVEEVEQLCNLVLSSHRHTNKAARIIRGHRAIEQAQRLLAALKEGT